MNNSGRGKGTLHLVEWWSCFNMELCKWHFFGRPAKRTPTQITYENVYLNPYSVMGRGAQHLPVDRRWRFSVRYFEIVGKIWSGNGIFNTKHFFAFNTCKVSRALWRLLKSKSIMQMSIYFYTLFSFITW